MKSGGKRLWLDDVRPAPLGWVHVKTAGEAIAALETGEYSEVSLDHDLGFTFDEGAELVVGGCLANQADEDGRTGYDVACWIEERAHAGTLFLSDMKCHSSNPSGKERIQAALWHARGWMDATLDERQRIARARRQAGGAR